MSVENEVSWSQKDFGEEKKKTTALTSSMTNNIDALLLAQLLQVM